MATSVTLKPNAIDISGSTSGTTTLQASAVAGTTTLTLPAATDTLVGKATTDTLTNKTLTGAAMNGTLGATTPSTASVTTLTTSSTVTHSGGTANGVAYLDGSKVLTTGSALVFDGSNLGVGTSSPTGGANRVVDVYGSSSSAINFHNATSGTTATDGGLVGQYGSDLVLYNYEAGIIQFGTSNAERARIDSSGNLLVGTTNSTSGGNATRLVISTDITSRAGISIATSANSSGGVFQQFVNASNSIIGSVTQSGTTAVLYNTTSDYRLKENIQPLSGALARVAALKPCTYTWKSAPEETGEGFIAHELQEVVPDAVSGEKDAVNEDGSIKPQGIDTSYLVATLTAAIQEMKAIIDTQASTITQLQADVAALKGA